MLDYDVELDALRMLVDRRDVLTRHRVQTVNRLQRLLSELLPGRAKKDITALQAKAMLAKVRPRDLAGKTRRRLAVEQLADLVAMDKKIKSSTKELKGMVLARGSTLMDLPGVGPVVAARILVDVGDVARFASWTGTAPLDASSGEQIRHRLSQDGTGMPTTCCTSPRPTQIRLDTTGRAYYRRKRAEGKTGMEAMRCLKRKISDAVYRKLVLDARVAGLGAHEDPVRRVWEGTAGRLKNPARSTFPLHIDTSDQPLPGTGTHDATRHPGRANLHAASATRPPRRRAGAVKVERPTARTTLTGDKRRRTLQEAGTAHLTTEGNRKDARASQQSHRGRSDSTVVLTNMTFPDAALYRHTSIGGKARRRRSGSCTLCVDLPGGGNK